MIVVDDLFDTAWADKKKWPYAQSCHLVSDQPGEAGERELMAFAERIGLYWRWIQKPGTVHVHFDLTPRMRARAVSEGARELTTAEMAELTLSKMGVVRR